MTSRALGRIHLAYTRGYVFIKQSDSPCKPSSSMLEPMILPKLLIHFADFPYRPSPPCRALHPRALMRFGTTDARPFQRAAHVARRITLPTFSPESCLRCAAAVAVRVATQRAVPRISARLPFLGVASPPSADEPVSACSQKCYYFQDLHRARLQPRLRVTFPGTRAPAYHALRRGPRAAGQRHPFSARRDSAGTL